MPMLTRRFVRAAVQLPAQYTIAGLPARAAIIDDLGGGGVRLQTEEDIAAGTLLTLRFLIDGAPITVTARIAMSLFDRSRSRFVHGVAFAAIDPSAVLAIERHVAVAATSPARPTCDRP